MRWRLRHHPVLRSVRKAPGELDEERLVQLMATGDRAAFEELYRRAAPWMALRQRRRSVVRHGEADPEVLADALLADLLPPTGNTDDTALVVIRL